MTMHAKLKRSHCSPPLPFPIPFLSQAFQHALYVFLQIVVEIDGVGVSGVLFSRGDVALEAGRGGDEARRGAGLALQRGHCVVAFYGAGGRVVGGGGGGCVAARDGLRGDEVDVGAGGC